MFTVVMHMSEKSLDGWIWEASSLQVFGKDAISRELWGTELKDSRELSERKRKCNI